MIKNVLAASVLLLGFLASPVSAEVLISDGGSLTPQGNNTVSYEYQNLGNHESIYLNFDLYIFDSWDGLNTSPVGQDFFGVRIDDTEYVWSFGGRASSYFMNDRTAEVDDDFVTGSYNDIFSWGDIDRYFSDYYNGFVIPHSAEDLTISFFGRGLQSINDESWAVDKLSIVTSEEMLFSGKSGYLLSDVGAPLMLSMFMFGAAAFTRRKS